MNCQDFEKMIVDAIDGRLIEAATREQLSAHAEGCRRCSAQMAFERRLTGHLKTLTTNDQTIKAPDSVKRELMAAFDERRKTQNARVSSVVRPLRRQNKHQLAWTLAVAAAVVLTISATAALWSKVNPGGGVDSGARPQPTAAARPAQTPLKPAPLPPSIKPTVAQATAGDQKNDAIGNLAHQTPAPVSKRKPRVSLPAVQESVETATDYFPLTAVAQTDPAEMQQIVRVEVPRSMLATWGVPVSADRTRTSIKADLVIGEDGVARAIRLVN